MNPDLYPVGKEYSQYKGAGRGLCNDSSHSRTGYSHVKAEDKERIQYDVDHGTNHNGEHTEGGIPLTGDELVESGGQNSKDSTSRVDGHIGIGIGIGGFTSAKGHEQRFLKSQKKGGQDHSQHAQHNGTVGQNRLSPLVIALSHSDGHQGCTAQSHQKGKRGDQGHHRTTNSGARQRIRTDFGDVANKDSVHDAVKHIHQLRQHGGNGQPQYQPGDVIFSQSVFMSHEKSPSCFP